MKKSSGKLRKLFLKAAAGLLSLSLVLPLFLAAALTLVSAAAGGVCLSR